MGPEISKKGTEARAGSLGKDSGKPQVGERARSCLLPQIPGPSSFQNTRLNQREGEGALRGSSSRWPGRPPQAEVPGGPPSRPATHLAPLVNTPVSNNKVAGHPSPAPDGNESPARTAPPPPPKAMTGHPSPAPDGEEPEPAQPAPGGEPALT